MRCLPCLLLLSACQAEPDPTTPAVCPCDAIALPDGPITTPEGLASLLDAVREAAFPDLDGVAIGMGPVDDLAYFRAWTELDTAGLDDGRARTYTVQYDPVVLADPPSPRAVAAVLAHELGHVLHYVGLNSDELVAFALWYATEDRDTSQGLADYERATDEVALERGCAAGLAEMHTWIYAHVSPEGLAAKQRLYYTPEEIAAWTEANGACPGG